MKDIYTKPLVFIGSSKKDLRKFPKAVCKKIGYDLYLVQTQEMPDSAKLLKGLFGVMELVERYDTDTYRSVYVANLDKAIFVLHCFKKKAKRGIKTPKANMDVIRQRLKEAKELDKGE
jgi:phage-related protein